MKQRTTYILRDGAAFKSSQLQVKKNSLQASDLDAVKEDRLTFGLAELPEDFQLLLRQCNELRIRWATSRPYTSVPPFAARMSAGLHVFYQPKPQDDTSDDLLCPTLKDAFGYDLECESPQKTFISRSRARDDDSRILQYWSDIWSLNYLTSYIQHHVCASSDEACLLATQKLNDAIYFDFDLDTASETVVLSAVWDAGSINGKWHEFLGLRDQQRHEVGVLYEEKPKVGVKETMFSGYLTVIGVDERPKPTLFSLPIQHYSADQSYTFSFITPTGLHPALSLKLNTNPNKPLIPTTSSHDQKCSLNLYTILPSALFLDRYQLADPVLLKQSGLGALTALKGATDLEAPTWTVHEWGSVALLQLNEGPLTNLDSKFSTNYETYIKLPTHLRYMPPSSGTNGIRDLTIPWPIVFWACPAPPAPPTPKHQDAVTPSSTAAKNPFARRLLGYDNDIDALFPPNTTFYHLTPSPNVNTSIADNHSLLQAQDDQLLLHLKVPVLDLDRAGYVEFGTAAVVWSATLWILWLLGRVVWRDWMGEKGDEHAGGKKEGEGEGEGEYETRERIVKKETRKRK